LLCFGMPAVLIMRSLQQDCVGQGTKQHTAGQPPSHIHATSRIHASKNEGVNVAVLTIHAMRTRCMPLYDGMRHAIIQLLLI